MRQDKNKDIVVRCGYKVGGGAERDQGFEKDYASGGKSKRNCHAEGGIHGIEVGDRKSESYTREFANGGQTKKCDGSRVKRDMGGSIKKLPANTPQSGAQVMPNIKEQKPQLNPASSKATPQVPINISYTLKKGGPIEKTKKSRKNNVKAAVKQMLDTKSTRPSAALIESITIRPKREKAKEESCRVEKAIGGAAKIRQGVFGLRGNPPIKR